jgi:RNA polymerase sigma-70 factor (ECF subfamily)
MDPKLVFEILMKENADMLLAFLRSAVGDPHAVDDLFQETMLTAWRRLPDFDRSRPFAPWLRGIAGNLVLAHYREQAHRAIPLDQAALDWLEVRFAKLHELQGDGFADKLAALRDCVQSLPDDYRRPVQMRFAQSLSLPEICESLQLATEALKKRLTRAKTKLADCLERKLNIAEPGR